MNAQHHKDCTQILTEWTCTQSEPWHILVAKPEQVLYWCDRAGNYGEGGVQHYFYWMETGSPKSMNFTLISSFILGASHLHDLGEPIHTLVPSWMPQPLPPRNQCMGWFAPAHLHHVCTSQKLTKAFIPLITEKIVALPAVIDDKRLRLHINMTQMIHSKSMKELSSVGKGQVLWHPWTLAS